MAVMASSRRLPPTASPTMAGRVSARSAVMCRVPSQNSRPPTNTCGDGRMVRQAPCLPQAALATSLPCTHHDRLPACLAGGVTEELCVGDSQRAWLAPYQHRVVESGVASCCRDQILALHMDTPVSQGSPLPWPSCPSLLPQQHL